MTQPAVELTAPVTGLALRQAADTGLYDPDLDFRKLLSEAGGDAFWSQGFRLVEKDDLLGVPHIIISLTYREGFPREGVREVKGDYVSVEAVIADYDILSAKPVLTGIGQQQHGITQVSDLKVFPNEAVIYNDGSTGIRRKVTEYATTAGVIDPGPDGPDVLSRYDRQFQRWVKGADIATEKIVAFANGEPFRVVARRGLRVSEYTNDYGDCKTYYLA